MIQHAQGNLSSSCAQRAFRWLVYVCDALPPSFLHSLTLRSIWTISGIFLVVSKNPNQCAGSKANQRQMFHRKSLLKGGDQDEIERARLVIKPQERGNGSSDIPECGHPSLESETGDVGGVHQRRNHCSERLGMPGPNLAMPKTSGKGARCEKSRRPKRGYQGRRRFIVSGSGSSSARGCLSWCFIVGRPRIQETRRHSID